MGSGYRSGDWHVSTGKEKEFVERWVDFLDYTRTFEGFDSAVLLQDRDNPSHFISMAEWDTEETAAAWRDSEGWGPRMAACRALCTQFYGTGYDEVVTVTAAEAIRR